MKRSRKQSNEWSLAVSLCDAIADENLQQLVSLLRHKHANPNILIPDFGIAPLHLAVGHRNDQFGTAATKLILTNGGNPNVIGTDGVTPLHVAVAWNKPSIVRLLLSYGADPWIEDDRGKNSFCHAKDEEAWETVNILEPHKFSKLSKNQKYKVRMDKTINRSKDVKAENISLCHRCIKHSKSSKQTVATQTSSLFSKSQLETDEMESEEFISANNSSDQVTDDKCYDWFDKIKDVVINEDCKRKIFQHRAKTKTYEYSPEKSSSSNNQSVGEADEKYSPPPGCTIEKSCAKETYYSNQFTEIEVSDDQLDSQSSDEKSYNAIVTKRESSPSTEELFSEDSLITEDRSSDCKSPNEIDFDELIKNIPYIDDSASVCSSKYNSSQKSESLESKKVKIDVFEEELPPAAVQVQREPLKENGKHVSWSACLNPCICISKSKDDDSVSSYVTRVPSEANVTTESCNGAISVVNLLSSSGEAVNITPDRRKYGSSGGEPSPEEEDCSIKYKYTDEDSIEFIEAKLPLSKNRSNKATPGKVSDDSDPSDFSAYDTDYIRRELKKLGFVSGPIAGTPTKRLYMKKLRRIQQTVSSPVMNLIKQPETENADQGNSMRASYTIAAATLISEKRLAFSCELEQVLKSDDWVEILSKWSHLEKQLREHFQDHSFSSSWRAGTAKTSFTYLLLDPRVSRNLPARCEAMELIDVWRTFVRSIFYVGKGTRARQYEHLYEALHIWRETKAYAGRHYNLKVSYILEIWREGLGVVCVQVFHNLIPAEAFTREAAMIDAIGLNRLKNEKAGVYYGLPNSWNTKMRRRLGTFLLYRAMRMFIADNEVQLKPSDVH